MGNIKSVYFLGGGCVFACENHRKSRIQTLFVLSTAWGAMVSWAPEIALSTLFLLKWKLRHAGKECWYVRDHTALRKMFGTFSDWLKVPNASLWVKFHPNVSFLQKINKKAMWWIISEADWAASESLASEAVSQYIDTTAYDSLHTVVSEGSIESVSKVMQFRMNI